MTERMCVLTHHTDPDRSRRALPGLLVCAGHQARAERWLRQLAPLHAALDAVVADAGRSGGPWVSGSREVGLDLSDRTVVVRHAIRHRLATWVLLVAEERDVTPPNLAPERRPVHLTPRRRLYHVTDPRTGTASVITRLSVVPREITEVQQLTSWLATWHDWLLAQEYVDDWVQDLADLHSEAWACAYPSGRRWHVIADCPEPACQGRLRAAVASQDELLPDRVVCTEEPAHAWSAAQWRLLRRTLPQWLEWLSIAALSQLHGIPSVTLYRWAREDGWRSMCRVPAQPWRSPGRHPALYHADEVEAAVACRRAVVDI